MTEERILAIKEKLWATARKKFPNDAERQNRYVWGTINNIKNHMKR